MGRKSKGFGFVSFLDSVCCARAIREMNGAYIGARPIKVKKSDWQDRDMNTKKSKQKSMEKKKKKFGL